jgi:hypothetical protein
MTVATEPLNFWLYPMSTLIVFGSMYIIFSVNHELTSWTKRLPVVEVQSRPGPVATSLRRLIFQIGGRWFRVKRAASIFSAACAASKMLGAIIACLIVAALGYVMALLLLLLLFYLGSAPRTGVDPQAEVVLFLICMFLLPGLYAFVPVISAVAARPPVSVWLATPDINPSRSTFSVRAEFIRNIRKYQYLRISALMAGLVGPFVLTLGRAHPSGPSTGSVDIGPLAALGVGLILTKSVQWTHPRQRAALLIARLCSHSKDVWTDSFKVGQRDSWQPNCPSRKNLAMASVAFVAVADRLDGIRSGHPVGTILRGGSGQIDDYLTNVASLRPGVSKQLDLTLNIVLEVIVGPNTSTSVMEAGWALGAFDKGGAPLPRFVTQRPPWWQGPVRAALTKVAQVGQFAAHVWIILAGAIVAYLLLAGRMDWSTLRP